MAAQYRITTSRTGRATRTERADLGAEIGAALEDVLATAPAGTVVTVEALTDPARPRRRRTLRRSQPRLVLCACGCGRPMRADAPWDGYHGPGAEPAMR